MIIQYASDLHLEFRENKEFLQANPLQPKGEILVLAGDIVPFAVMNKYADFFDYLSDHFEETYWVPGNHEYYYFDVATKCGTIHEDVRHNVHLVNNVSVVRDNVKLIFSTLWTHIRPAYEWQIERGMSDFQVIKYEGYRFSVAQYNQLHRDCLMFLQQELNTERANRTVVVSHHVPTFMNYPDKYKGDMLNDAFAVELFDLIEQTQPDCWIYGHSHGNTPDFGIGNTRLLTNQLGYVKYGEGSLFGGKCIVVV